MNDQLDQYDFVDTDYMDQNSVLFAKPIGEFLISFSYLEHALDRLISEIINDRTDSIGYLITAEMKMANKIDLLQRFVKLEKYHGLKRPRRINPVISKLKMVNTFRNRIAHANWSSMRADGMTRIKTKVDKDNGVFFENFNLSKEEIKRAQSELDSLIQQIDNLELEP
jgi:hypothetical protein